LLIIAKSIFGITIVDGGWWASRVHGKPQTRARLRQIYFLAGKKANWLVVK